MRKHTHKILNETVSHTSNTYTQTHLSEFFHHPIYYVYRRLWEKSRQELVQSTWGSTGRALNNWEGDMRLRKVQQNQNFDIKSIWQAKGNYLKQGNKG